MCPTNRIGTVDLFVVSHHGQAISNSPVLVHALQPRVAIMNNGTRKGGQPDAMKVIYSSPGLEDLWQMHFSLLSGQEYTVPGMFIANPVDDQPAAMPIAAHAGAAAGARRAAAAGPQRRRPTGSRSRRRPTARSPSRTRATGSARPTRRRLAADCTAAAYARVCCGK